RNSSYSRGILRSARAARPVISVGNITTGGTGKTPVVRWLASRLRDQGKHVAILLRGYKSAGAAGSDERELLDRLLNASTSDNPVIVHANPDRVAGAAETLQKHPDVDVFVLDDGFQHRRLQRDFDLVLIDATNPFGFGHVLPRGLLREPLGGLGRASALLITRCDQVAHEALGQVEQKLKWFAPAAPVLHSI